ncbi:hypothetical protein M011DRAFT_44205 [Sporormia fimetaria CBS 119925]|uniref:Uncharacterized protein n=1 Tax=Sporormia fimetaria CBS 119925 TaxID=1340428 RepID=A0A6A6VCY3_9PLEO|nr:hypothetical protein M011DRAFT_44205 [Sporormia fimetaria CBS 119925]
MSMEMRCWTHKRSPGPKCHHCYHRRLYPHRRLHPRRRLHPQCRLHPHSPPCLPRPDSERASESELGKPKGHVDETCCRRYYLLLRPTCCRPPCLRSSRMLAPRCASGELLVCRPWSSLRLARQALLRHTRLRLGSAGVAQASLKSCD